MIKEVLYILLVTSVMACSSTRNKANIITPAMNATENKTVNSSFSTENTRTNRAFWGRLLSEACNRTGKENICLSPLSAQLAMAMIANGAEGKTREEIYDALQLGEDANTRYRKLLDNLENKYCEVKVANSIWIKERFDVKQEFINTNKEYLGALVERAEFNNETVKRINEWCKENTNGKIPSIIDSFNDSDRMILLNALYFNGKWDRPFKKEKTTQQRFTTEKGEVVKVPMMMLRANKSYYKDNVLTMTIKRYESGYSMLLVLPNEGVKCDEAAEHLAKDFDAYLKAMEIRDLTLSLPKFKTNFSGSIKPILTDLGIKRAFGSKAQFGGISDKALYISDIVQKTYINVDEKGTEAAAVTMGRAGALSMRPPKTEIMTFDRPFIYAIINHNNDVLFIGKVGNPNVTD